VRQHFKSVSRLSSSINGQIVQEPQHPKGSKFLIFAHRRKALRFHGSKHLTRNRLSGKGPGKDFQAHVDASRADTITPPIEVAGLHLAANAESSTTLEA